jgi:hypothetical protein
LPDELSTSPAFMGPRSGLETALERHQCRNSVCAGDGESAW